MEGLSASVVVIAILLGILLVAVGVGVFLNGLAALGVLHGYGH